MQVQKWGNSLGIRLPKALCQLLHIEEGKEVDFTVEKGAIVIRPKAETLEDMLKGISPEMYHKETMNDGPIGKEEW